jgi:hypothetical protein
VVITKIFELDALGVIDAVNPVSLYEVLAIETFV